MSTKDDREKKDVKDDEDKDVVSVSQYSDKSIAIRADKAKWDKPLRKIGARWYMKTRGGPSWLISKDKLKDLEALLGEKLDLFDENKDSGLDTKHTKESDKD